ncbi:dTDP-glucose 4,6-dehydratase [Eggerthella guodeyinii]|uniref:dTDP-glucose 4,6-dehydratase n=1 Tax=Eggerthella guodeyinii TaxID=2690837 RepID=A0A6L7INC5_9ACTN|nr:dTDP-glucose 4,6-dehydratase [Eggerthella guodeyinii]QOS67613.1 dTDP-glucose 4,6-dehydratase [Eggerthella guodeyinii]
MNVLVTGGAGFIGSNFIYHQLGKHPNDRVVCLDSLTYAGNVETLRPAFENPRFRFVRADVRDEASVRALFFEEGFDAVINFAAESHVDRSISDPDLFLKTNVTGTRVLMDACLEYGVGRFHQVSTDEVYGDLPLDRPDLLFVEEALLFPSSPYSASKASADLLVGAYVRTFGLSATISRCSNNYGPFQFPEKLIPLMVSRALAGKPLPVYGDGLNVRDWLYVEDHCEAIDLVMREGEPGRVYNVGGHNEMSNIDIVRFILERLGKPESLISYVEDRKGHDRRYAIDPARIRNELGWEPRTVFADGIEQTVDWYLANEGWWQRILDGRYLEANQMQSVYKGGEHLG